MTICSVIGGGETNVFTTSQVFPLPVKFGFSTAYLIDLLDISNMF